MGVVSCRWMRRDGMDGAGGRVATKNVYLTSLHIEAFRFGYVDGWNTELRSLLDSCRIKDN